MLNVRLVNGCGFSIPLDAIPDLRRLSDRELAKVEVWPYGLGLRWDDQDIDLSVVGLARIALVLPVPPERRDATFSFSASEPKPASLSAPGAMSKMAPSLGGDFDLS